MYLNVNPIIEDLRLERHSNGNKHLKLHVIQVKASSQSVTNY